ncbi:aldehyde reductase [Aquimarina sp. RZ0]|uniref:SDR family oxidoreductase n=1 Tax=Aquimarina sp. RZ0 TaxID=2607730 RepID=UPI0011F32558|nr:aldehyde reductase [Aquimarina sp. RZ0]KAA1247875.1 aldehyde reductase [Aquimarina sp. RZ0]
MNKKKVLVTGVTGFLGSHTTIQLLNKGYEVTGTLRNMERAEEIKKVISDRVSYIDSLSFAQADLMDTKIWETITEGMDYVLHIASPFPRELPKKEDDLIIPAKTGTLNVLRAAANNKVKRVVLTSSSGAVVYGKEKSKRSFTFNENDWTDISNKKDTTPYFRSKTIAEKAAWDFIKNDTSGLELSTICPVAILGPVLEKDFGTSANIVIKCLDGSTPAIPKIGFEMVDVRSIAELHIKAMEEPKAAGERFIGAAGFLDFNDVAAILRAKYPHKKIPKISLPDFAVRIFSNFDKAIKPILIELGTQRKVDATKAKILLKWEPIPVEEAVLACAESVLNLNIV